MNESKKQKKAKPMKIKPLLSAADRNRTGTGIATHGILSPGRLPVPPLRQTYASFSTQNHIQNLEGCFGGM